MDKCLCCGRDNDVRSCEACGVALGGLDGEASRSRARDRAVAALGPWGRARYWFGAWLGSASVAYYGDGHRWWHGGHTLLQRAWLLLVPALGASERLFALAAEFGRPV
jgi:hypothetical protein